MKVEEHFTGHKYELQLTPCTKKCGGGVHSPVCKSESGKTAKMGLCSAMVAMNADAELEETECHKQTCEPEKVSPYKKEYPYKKCFEQEMEMHYYYYWHFSSDGYITTRDWDQRNWYGTGQRGDGYYDLMAYAGDYEEGRIVFTEEQVIGNGFHLKAVEAKEAPIQAVFQCPGAMGGLPRQGVNVEWEVVDSPEGRLYGWTGTYTFTHPCACPDK